MPDSRPYRFSNVIRHAIEEVLESTTVFTRQHALLPEAMVNLERMVKSEVQSIPEGQGDDFSDVVFSMQFNKAVRFIMHQYKYLIKLMPPGARYVDENGKLGRFVTEREKDRTRAFLLGGYRINDNASEAYKSLKKDQATNRRKRIDDIRSGKRALFQADGGKGKGKSKSAHTTDKAQQLKYNHKKEPVFIGSLDRDLRQASDTREYVVTTSKKKNKPVIIVKKRRLIHSPI